MPKPFSPSRALGIPPQDYDSYFDGEEGVPVFNPDRGYSARGSMVSPYDAYSDQFGQFAADQGLQTLDAQKDLLNNGAQPLLTPDGRAKRLDYMLKGVISPQQEHAIEHFEAPSREHLSKYSPVPVDVAKAASELDYIDPTAPDALEQRNKILRDIDNHPEWGGSNLKTHPYFQSKDEKFLHNYYAHRNLTGTAERHAETSDLTQIHKALTSDVPTDALRPYLDPEMRRITDHAGFADVVARASHNKAVMTPKVKQKLLEMEMAAQHASATDPSVPAKEAWLAAQGIDDPKTPDWVRADQALRTEPVRAYYAFRNSLGLHDLGHASAPQQEEVPAGSEEELAAPAAAQPQAPQPYSPQQFNAAVEILKQRPNTAAFFDRRFGAGSAAKVLGQP